MSNTKVFILTCIACSFFFLFFNNQTKQEIHISGQLTPTGFLLQKSRVEILFNGYSVINGILDSSHNGQLHGEFNGKIATATCSGADVIKCLIKYDDKERLVTFTTTK